MNLDDLADTYQSDVGALDIRFTSQYTWRLIQDDISGPRVLLLGIGNGHIMSKLIETGYDLTVIEGSEKLIGELLELPDNVRIIHSRFEDFKDGGEFDTIVATHVLEHVDKPAAVIEMVKRQMTEIGLAIFTVPNGRSIHRRAGVKMGILSSEASLAASDESIGHKRVYSPSQFFMLMVQAFKTFDFRGYMLKMGPNELLKPWDETLIDALYEVSLELDSELCANLAAFCRSPK